MLSHAPVSDATSAMASATPAAPPEIAPARILVAALIASVPSPVAPAAPAKPAMAGPAATWNAPNIAPSPAFSACSVPEAHGSDLSHWKTAFPI